MEEAEVAKTQGTEAFAAKDYDRALALFTKAIALAPRGPYFCNRSATYMALKQEEWAVEDALAAVQVEPKNGKGYLRLGHALAACWRRSEARGAYETSFKLAGPSDTVTAALRTLDQLKPVEELTAESLTAEVEALAPKRHGLAQVQEFAHKLEAAGMICRSQPYDPQVEALLFMSMSLFAERKFYHPKPQDANFPLVACRAIHILNRCPQIEGLTMQMSVKVVMRDRVHNLLRNCAAAAVRHCEESRVPAPPSVLAEMQAILSASPQRPPFHRFIALWVLSVSLQFGTTPAALLLCKQRGDQLIDLGPAAKVDAVDDLQSQVKPIVDDTLTMLKNLFLNRVI